MSKVLKCSFLHPHWRLKDVFSRSSDSGVYSCCPDNAHHTNVTLHILTGETTLLCRHQLGVFALKAELKRIIADLFKSLDNKFDFKSWLRLQTYMDLTWTCDLEFGLDLTWTCTWLGLGLVTWNLDLALPWIVTIALKATAERSNSTLQASAKSFEHLSF